MVLKQAIKTVASSRDLYATFMPKPIFGINGSGMHTHQSLFDKNGRNLFYDKKDKYKLSSLARYFMGGQLEHIREIAAILCPTVNSYKRLVRGYEAPIYICWGQRNRSALIRVPRYREGREKSTRLELRCPDPSCNPYLAFAVMLAAGLKGIEEKIEPPDPVEEDVYGFDDRKLAKFYIKTLPEDLGEAIEEFKRSKLMKETLGGFDDRKLAKFYIKTLPEDLGEAIEEFKRSKLMKETLGEHVFNKYLEIKTTEWNEFQKSVTDWEHERYRDL